jgi:hypothetical protein
MSWPLLLSKFQIPQSSKRYYRSITKLLTIHFETMLSSISGERSPSRLTLTKIPSISREGRNGKTILLAGQTPSTYIYPEAAVSKDRTPF